MVVEWSHLVPLPEELHPSLLPEGLSPDAVVCGALRQEPSVVILHVLPPVPQGAGHGPGRIETYFLSLLFLSPGGPLELREPAGHPELWCERRGAKDERAGAGEPVRARS